jgi:hypothetical protein
METPPLRYPIHMSMCLNAIAWVCVSFSPPVEPISSRKPTITDGAEASFQLSINGRRGRKRSVRVKREN